MSQAPDRRYSDRDIEDDPYLTTWAEAYAAQYTGDYAPMVEACREFRQQHGLSPRTARIVLNIARNDSRVRDRLPVPAAPKEIVLPERDGSTPTPRPRVTQPPRRPIAVVSEPSTPVRIWLGARIVSPYMTGIGKSAKLIHLSNTRQFARARWDLDRELQKFGRDGSWSSHVHLRDKPALRHLVGIEAASICNTPKAAWATPVRLTNPLLLTEAEAMKMIAAGERIMCQKCAAKALES